MAFVPVLHAELIKIRTLRSLVAALSAVLVITAVFSVLAGLGGGVGDDPLFSALFGVTFGQIAAVAFGSSAMSSDVRGEGLRSALVAVPQRGRWFAAKATAITVPVLAVGPVTGIVSFALGRAALGDALDRPSWADGLRAASGCGVYLTLMALLGAGLTALLRSGTATLSLLVPFLLTVSFVVGDMAGGAADLLPDRAGQVVLHGAWDGVLGPWTGLGVTALWTAAALAAGAWRVRCRDA